MNQFTASNGRIIVTSEEACGASTHVKIGFGEGGRAGDFTMTAAERDALREFFRAEEDERLGRWRWPDNTDYLVYEDGDGDVVVFNELKATVSSLFIQRDLSQRNPNHPATQAARAYFDAHPEPKPWHDAKPGEVWALTVDGEESAFYPSKSLDRAFTPVAPETGRTAVSMESFEITAGRRIYPEVTE